MQFVQTGRERYAWSRILRHRLPLSLSGLARDLGRLPDVDAIRPLRIEVLAASGRFDEARVLLDRMATETAERRLRRAALGELISVLSGGEDLRAGIRSIAAETDDPVVRRAAEVELAHADALREPRPGIEALRPLARVAPDRVEGVPLGERLMVGIMDLALPAIAAIAVGVFTLRIAWFFAETLHAP